MKVAEPRTVNSKDLAQTAKVPEERPVKRCLRINELLS